MRDKLLSKAFEKTINETLKTCQNKSVKEKITNELLNIYSAESKDQLNKLSELDSLIESKRENLRDIKSVDYIKEIFDSYVFNDKVEFINKINELCEERRKNINLLLKQLNEVKEKNNSIVKENESKKQKFNDLIDFMYEIK